MSEAESRPGDPDQEDLERQVRARLGSRIEGVGVLEEIVGIGGMATVYRADTGSDESVAVKLMHEHLADKGSLRRRFNREAKILDQVDHPNSIKVFDRGTAESGEAYFVMELLDGWEVETVWKKKDREFPVVEALEIGEQALACLHAYHEADVLHRDLKPSNLFLTRGGIVKLIDFGVARFRDQGSQKTRAGTALGTPAYMAPEQAMGKVEILDRRTDVYGLGAVLFTLLSGRRVHEAESNDETLVMAATQPADSLAQHAPDIPTPVVQAIDRALAWDPDDRFASAEQMRAEISGLLEDPSEDLERREHAPDEDFEGTDEALEREAADFVVDIDEKSIEGMDVMFERLEKALGAARIYEWDHDKTRQSIEHAYEAFRKTIDRERGEVFWKVRPHSFEIDGVCLWNPEESFELVPYNLFLDGFRRIQLRSSMLLEEFVEFAKWLVVDPEHDLPAEDDLATALWELDLESVDGRVVTSPSMIDPDREDLVLEEETDDLMERAETLLVVGAGERLLAAMRTGAYAEAEAMAGAASGAESGGLGRDFTRSTRGLVEGSREEELARAIDRSDQQWEQRLERVVSDLWGETVELGSEPAFVEAMRDLVVLYLDSDRLGPLMRILIRSFQRLDAPAERRFFVDRLLDDDRLLAITAALREHIPTGGAEASDPQKLLKLYGRLLKIVPVERFETLLEAFEPDHEPVRRVLAQYLRRHAEGNEVAIARALPDVDLEGRKVLVRIVAKTGTQAAFDVVSGELESEEAELRRLAMELVNKHFDLELDAWDVSEQLETLIEDSSEELRLGALKLARKTGASRLVPAIADRATGSDFNGLSTEERREVLQTLAVLSRSKAQEIACELAEHHGVMPSDDRQKTRVLAFRILGEIGSDERALEATESGKGGWWWNSDEVKEAAEAAHEQIARRLEANV